MKRTRRELLSILFTLAMVLSLFPAVALTAGAWDGDPYASLVNTTTTVKFNDMDWYIIEDHSTAADAGSLTLFAKECVGASAFSTSGDKVYSRSTVKGYLDGLTAAGGSFAGVADAIVGTDLTDVSVTGAKLYLLSTAEANAVPADARICSQASGAVRNYWWLRSYSSWASSAVFVNGADGTVYTDGNDVGSSFGVRPALQLDLSKVTFDSASKTFAVSSTTTVSFSKVTSSESLTADSIGTCTEAEAKAWIKDNFDDIKSEIAAASKSAWFGFKGSDFKPGDNIHYIEVSSSTAVSGVDNLSVSDISVDGFNARRSMRILYVCDPSGGATDAVASVTTAGGVVTNYADLPTAVSAWNDIDGSTLTPLVDYTVTTAFAVPAGHILEIPERITVTGADGGSIDNNGIINISGTVDASKGTITTAGTVSVTETGTLLIAAMPGDGELTVTAGGIVKVPVGEGVIAVVGNEETSPEEAATRLLAGTLSFSMTADGFTDILDKDGELIVYAWDMDTSAPGATGQKKLINNGKIYVPEDCKMSLGVNTTMTGPDGTVIIDGTVDASKGSIEDVGTVKVTEFGTLLIQAVPKTGELTVEADGVVAVPTPYKTIVIVGSVDTSDAGIILERGTMTFLMEKSGNTYTVEEGSKLRVNQWDLDSSFHGAGVDKTLVNKGAILVQPDGALTLGENTTMTGANGTVTISGTVDASKGVIEDAGVICVEETGTLRTGPMPQTGEVTVKAGGLIEVPVSPEAKIVVVGNQTTPNAGIILKEGAITFLMEANSNTYTVGENSTLDVNSWDLGSQFHGGTGQKTLVNDGTINVPGVLTIDANSTLENNGTVSLTAKTAKVIVYEETKGALVVENSDGGVHSGQGAEAKTVYSCAKGPAAEVIPADIPDSTTKAVETTADLVIDAVAGQEYVLVRGDAEPDWTEPLTITDGKITIPGGDMYGGARYAVYTRVAETATTLAGDAVSTPFVTTVTEYGWYGDGDPELIGSTITADFEAEDELTYQWYQCSDEDGTDASPISGQTGIDFKVPSSLKGKYYFAAVTIDGIEAGRFDPQGPVSYGTVIFDSKGGSPVEEKTGLTFGTKLEQPESTRSGWYLEGWYLDEDYKDAWTFDTNVVNWVETTLYAKWSKVPAYGIQGVVYASDGKTPQKGVEVSLMQGDATFGTAITNAAGEFSLSAVAGDYNVVAVQDIGEDIALVKTELVTLTQEGQTLTIIMPEAGRNSVLDNSDAGDFAATVGGLDEIAAGTDVDEGQQVTITLSVVAAEKVSAERQAAFAASQAAIQAVPEAAGKTMDYLDMTLEKTVNTATSSETKEISDNDQLLTIIIPYDTSGKTNITVFRATDDGAEAMQQNPGEGQEGFKVENGVITIYTTDPTTCGIGYNTVSPSSGGGGGSVTSYPVNTPAAANGTMSSNLSTARAGDKVTVTVKPDEGYVTTGVTVTDAKGNNVPVTQNADGTYSFTMPSTAVTVTPTFAKAGEQPPADDGACPKDSTCPISKFSDASPTAWYHDGVHWALVEGIMNGVSDTRFAPNGTTTRAMVVTMLWRMAGEPASSAPAPFTDVSSDAWYADAVAWAAENDAVNGTSADTFSPNTPVTREQLAAILYRYAQAQGKGFTGAWAFPLDYPDAADVSEYANEAMHWMTMNGVITGMSDGTLAPRDNATRAQIATMFMRFVEAMEK